MNKKRRLSAGRPSYVHRAFKGVVWLVLFANLLSVCAFAAPEDEGGATEDNTTQMTDDVPTGIASERGTDWLSTDVYTGTNTFSYQSAQSNYKSTLELAIKEFDDCVTSNAGSVKYIQAYGRTLAVAEWFTNNYYTLDGQERSTIVNSSGLVDVNGGSSILALLNRIPEMASTIAGLPDITNSQAFSTIPGEVTAENIIGFNDYHEALTAILNNYIEPGILDAVSDVKWDVGWTLTEEQTSVSAEMSTALAGKKEALDPYRVLYQQIFDVGYSVYLGHVIKTETFKVNGTDVSVVGFTRSKSFENFIADEFDPQCRTICTWLSISAETDSGSGNKTSSEPGINSANLDEGVLPALSNAHLVGSEIVIKDGNEIKLTELGYYILAAGVAYDPFVSQAGNDAYIALLKELMRETDKAEPLIQTIQIAVNKKKPLFVTDGTLESWVNADGTKPIDIANYRQAHLGDMLDASRRCVSAYVCLNGDMRPSTIDSSTWDYVRDGTGTSSYSDSSATMSTGSAGIANDVTLDTAEGYRMTGSTEFMASASQVTAPLMFTTGNSYSQFSKQSAGRESLAGRIAGMTSMILNNAAKDCRDNQHIQQASTELVFVNGLGDIVLSDGTIILPAIANPALYVYNLEEGSDASTAELEPDTPEDAVETSGAVFLKYTYGYYPYTATLLNHYPSASFEDGGVVKVRNSNDEDKYIMSWIQADWFNKGGFEATQIKSTGDKQVDVMDITTLPSVWIAGNSFSVKSEPTDTLDAMPLLAMPQGAWRSAGESLNKLFAFITAGEGNVGDSNAFSQRYLQSYVGMRNGYNEHFFPVIPPESELLDSYLNQVLPLITSAVRFISTQDSMDGMSSSGKFRIDSYIRNFVAQGMLGTQYSDQLVKSNQLSYEELVENQYGRFTRLVKDFVSEVISTVGHIDGVLAIKDGYGNGFFNVVMGFVQQFYLIIVVVLLIIVATKFIRGRFSFFYVVFIGCFTFAAFNVYAVWMPTAVPALYNMFVNDIVEEVTWNTVATTAEQYSDTYMKSNSKDATSGEDRPYTATITLYKMTQAEMKEAADILDVDIAVIRKGQIVYLDRTGGVFIQGDQIKMSIDSLLANNTMRGLYQSQWDLLNTGSSTDDNLTPVTRDTSDNPYVLRLENPYVGLESYYMPFCHFERAFLRNLNNFASIFRVERNYYQYPGGIYKDAFLFNAYTNSGIFTAPGNDDVLALSIVPSEILGNSVADTSDIINLCHQCMDPMEDWLNLRSVFNAPDAVMKNSLWGRMLIRQGYYGQDWSMTTKQEEQLSDLIYYINAQTKKFVINNQDQLNFLSDENAIKLVTLYATTCFTHRVSTFGYWLYPNYINSCDIELCDVLYGAMTTYRDRNAALDGDLLNTVVLNLGFIGAILILGITVISTVFVFILTYLVPCLYGLFGVLLVYKLVNNEQGTGLIKGYVKVTVVSTLLYIIFSFSLRMVKFGGYAWYGYLMALLLDILCLYFLLYVVMSVVTNPLELGNDVIARNLFGALDRLTKGRLGRLTSNHLTVNTHRTSSSGVVPIDFMRGSALDNRWTGRFSRRGSYGYGRYDGYDNYGNPGSFRERLLGGIGNRFSGFGRTRVGYRNSSGWRNMANSIFHRHNWR